jgi:aminopeptidase 2
MSVWNYYPIEVLTDAYEYDSLSSTSHPIQMMKVIAPNDLPDIFNDITYSKSSCVIRMLEEYMGASTFKHGLRKYFQKFAFKNTTTKDLWECLETTNENNIQSLMNDWTRRSGYPVVNVKLELNDQGRVTLRLEQMRYFKNVEETNEDLWKIPITIIRTQTSQMKSVLLTEKSLSVDLGDEDFRNTCILINHEKIGFYRVCYSNEMFNTLIEQIETFNSSCKMGLIEDSFALAWSNHLSCFELMRFVWSLRNEHDSFVWKFLLDHVHKLVKCFVFAVNDDDDVYEGLIEFLKRFMEPILEKVNYEESGDLGKRF